MTNDKRVIYDNKSIKLTLDETNRKRDEIVRLLTKLVNIEESRAAKTGDLPKPSSSTRITMMPGTTTNKIPLPLGSSTKEGRE